MCNDLLGNSIHPPNSNKGTVGVRSRRGDEVEGVTASVPRRRERGGSPGTRSLEFLVAGRQEGLERTAVEEERGGRGILL